MIVDLFRDIFTQRTICFWELLNRRGFVISLSGCVAALGVGGVKRRTLVRAFQCTKEHWISLSRSKVMII
jgi:hypothetical protein